MTPSLVEALCGIIDAQNDMIRQLVNLLAQHQEVEEYEKELAEREREYAAIVSGEEGRCDRWTP